MQACLCLFLLCLGSGRCSGIVSIALVVQAKEFDQAWDTLRATAIVTDPSGLWEDMVVGCAPAATCSSLTRGRSVDQGGEVPRIRESAILLEGALRVRNAIATSIFLVGVLILRASLF